jgi:hypothetical protein
MLAHYNEQKCDPPWEYGGIKQKISNGYAYASIRPIGGGTAQADFAGDKLEPFKAHGKNREENFVTVNGYKFAVTRTPRSKKKSKRTA